MNGLNKQIKQILEFELFHYMEYQQNLKDFYSGNTPKIKPVYIKRIEYICGAIERTLAKLSDERRDFANVYFFNKAHSSLQRIAFNKNYDLSTIYRIKNKIIDSLAFELGYR